MRLITCYISLYLSVTMPHGYILRQMILDSRPSIINLFFYCRYSHFVPYDIHFQILLSLSLLVMPSIQGQNAIPSCLVVGYNS